MNSIQSANNVLNLIISQSKLKIHQNKIIKNLISSYATQKFTKLKSDLLNQTGIQNDFSNAVQFRKQQNLQIKPTTNDKDSCSFFSVRKIQQQKKQNKFVSVQKQPTLKTKRNRLYSMKNSTKLKSSSFNVNENTAHTKQTTLKDKQQAKINNFIILEDQKTIKIPRWQKKQQNQIQYLRQIINQKQLQRKQQLEQQQKDENMMNQKKLKLKSYLQNHMSRVDNSFTFDIDGKLLLYTSQNHCKNQIPYNIRYNLSDNNDDQSLRNKKHQKRGNKIRNKKLFSQVQFYDNKDSVSENINIQGARGEIFKSTVMKTVNLSRMSLGNNQIDELGFMRRNDLFNNNHCRQVTSIPFIQLEDGSSYLQLANNSKIEKKDKSIDNELDKEKERTVQQQNKNKNKRTLSQDRARSEFIKFSSKLSPHKTNPKSYLNNPESRSNSFSVNRNSPASNDNNNNNKIKNTSSSFFTSKRPHTTQIGRINRENEQLVLSMLYKQ